MSKHGGNITKYINKYGFEPMDISANLNPYGTPASVKQALSDAIADAEPYPDPDSWELRGVIAASLPERQGRPVDKTELICGNGAADLLYRMVYAIRPKRALILAPGFSDYQDSLEQVDCDIDYYMLLEENGFVIGRDILDRIDESMDMVIFANPNNPTGVMCDDELLDDIADKCAKNDCVFVIDESFNQFVIDGEKHTYLSKLSDPHVLVINSMTKFYAMAGVRLGYLTGTDAEFLQKLHEGGAPWNVSIFAQRAGVAAVKDTEYGIDTPERMREERQFLTEELEKMGFKVIPGEANFLLFKSDRADLDVAMEKGGIMIRNCNNYRGLSDGWFRIAVRFRLENTYFINVLKEVLYG